jgi:hypothetical protein
MSNLTVSLLLPRDLLVVVDIPETQLDTFNLQKKFDRTKTA